jgi:hypothetical protein
MLKRLFGRDGRRRTDRCAAGGRRPVRKRSRCGGVQSEDATGTRVREDVVEEGDVYDGRPGGAPADERLRRGTAASADRSDESAA